MRLIDADRLMDEMVDNYTPEPNTSHWLDMELARTAPTVDAIPVDWLREHRKQTRYKRSARIIEQLVRLYQEEQER